MSPIATEPSEWRLLGPLSNFPRGVIVPCQLGTRSLIVVHLGDSFYCFNDECAHQPVKLSEFGELGSSGVLLCHAHGACFDLRNGGLPLCFPAEESLVSWKTRVNGINLEILLDIV